MRLSAWSAAEVEAVVADYFAMLRETSRRLAK
jgi:hypothetical protein